MAHKIFNTDEEPVKKHKKYTLPNLNGKFGVSLYIKGKEYFIGLAVNDVVVEQVVRKRFIKTPKGTVKTYSYDPL